MYTIHILDHTDKLHCTIEGCPSEVEAIAFARVYLSTLETLRPEGWEGWKVAIVRPTCQTTPKRRLTNMGTH